MYWKRVEKTRVLQMHLEGRNPILLFYKLHEQNFWTRNERACKEQKGTKSRTLKERSWK